MAETPDVAETSGALKLFGFEIRRAQKLRQEKEKLTSIVPPTDEDGAGYLTASGSYFGQYVNFDGGNDAKDNAQLIRQYRGVAMHPEVDDAIDHIVNEAISSSEDESSVELVLDDAKLSSGVKKKMTEEFDYIVGLLKFNEIGYDIFRRWYIDGRIYHHLVVEKGREKEGILDVRPIDAAKIRKMKEVVKKKDPGTGVSIIESVKEYYIYQEKPGMQNTGIKLTDDSVSYVTSGLLDQDMKRVVSYLHKALKPINQLRMMEDSLVIYRLARAPERRIFYIDVGNLPRGKAEQYMKDIMSRYRNKIVYDAETGNLKDDRKHMSMLEDFWLPRREGGRGTEISTLPGGENLGQIEDIIYFQKRLYRALNVPISRLDSEQSTPFGMGRPSEITRDELRFQKFIDRLRTRFSSLFLDILRKHLILKNIITEDDWEAVKNDIIVNFIRDNHFTELKDAELLREKLQTLDQIQNHVGTYFSKEWVMKNVLHFSDEDIKEMQKQMDKEEEEAPEDDGMGGIPGQGPGAGGPPQQFGQPSPGFNVQVTPSGPQVNASFDYEDIAKKTEIELMSEITNYLKGA